MAATLSLSCHVTAGTNATRCDTKSTAERVQRGLMFVVQKGPEVP